MLKEIQKEVEDLRIKVYAGQSLEDTEKALYEIEQMLFKEMDKQLNIPIVSQQRELLIAFMEYVQTKQAIAFIDKNELADKFIEVINCG